MNSLILVHGRAQQGRSADAVKAEWLGAFTRGLARAAIDVDLSRLTVEVPYYGDILETEISAAEYLIKGATDSENAEGRFTTEMMREVCDEIGIRLEGQEKGLQNHPMTLELARSIEQRSGLACELALAVATHDVWQYLNNATIGNAIDALILKELSRASDGVVVLGHSLGTVIAYRAICALPDKPVSTLITLGSPLGFRPIRNRLYPRPFPSSVRAWHNFYDPLDIVALHALDSKYFPFSTPAERSITNCGEIENFTENHHSIIGYLDNPVVAGKLLDALTLSA